MPTKRKRKPSKKGRATRPPQHPWEKQPGESAQSYSAFREYLLMGPARSTAKVARRLGKSKALIDRWSSRDQWVARVETFEAEASRKQDEALVDELAERSRRQAELATEALEAMAAPSLELMRRLKKNPKLLEKLDVDQLLTVAATTARAMPRVQSAERLARGQSTTNVGGHRGGPLEIDETNKSARARADAERRVKDMTDEALDSFLIGADTARRMDAAAQTENAKEKA
jgi:hypothetical protein